MTARDPKDHCVLSGTVLKDTVRGVYSFWVSCIERVPRTLGMTGRQKLQKFGHDDHSDFCMSADSNDRQRRKTLVRPCSSLEDALLQTCL